MGDLDLTPMRMNILLSLEDVSFMTHGRDFQTLLIAFAKVTGDNVMYLDKPRIVANLGQLRIAGLIKKKVTFGPEVRWVGGDRYKKKHVWWRLTDEGHAVLAYWRTLGDTDNRVPSGGIGEPVAEAGSELPTDDSPHENQRGHDDDDGRSGTEPSDDEWMEDDPGDYSASYRPKRW